MRIRARAFWAAPMHRFACLVVALGCLPAHGLTKPQAAAPSAASASAADAAGQMSPATAPAAAPIAGASTAQPLPSGLSRLEGAVTLSGLESNAARWVRQGLDDPDAVLRQLDDIEQGLDKAAPLVWLRVIERTRGLIGARAGREVVAAEAAGRLAQMADSDSVAAADAAMIRAELDDQLWRTESATAHALEADAAYLRACSQGPRAAVCDHRGWWSVIRLLVTRADRQGNRLEAARLQERANELARQAGDDSLLAIGLGSLSVMSAGLNERDKALRELGQAERLLQKNGDRDAMIAVLGSRALLNDRLGERALDGRTVRATLDQALRLARELGSSRQEALALGWLSDELLKSGRPAEALAAVERALPVVQRFNDRRRVPVLLHNGGLARLRLGQVAQGKADLEQAINLWQQARARARIEAALNESADALAAIGDMPAALQNLHRAEQLRREIDEETRSATLSQLQERFRSEAGQRDLELAERENALKSARLDNQTLIQRVWMMASLVLALAAGVLVLQLRRTRSANQQLRHSESLLRVQSERDPLTGLANRRHFRELIAARQPGGGAFFQGGLVLLDIDHFKRINDDYGHVCGDAVLVEVGRRLDACVRAGDVACRWGGEEFLLHTPGQSLEAVESLALRVLQEIGHLPVRLPDGREIAVTMSLSYAAFPLAPHGVTLPWEQAVNLVDMGLFHAKGGGRDRAVGIVSTTLRDGAALHAAAGDFDQALRDGRIVAQVTSRVP